MKMKFWKRLSFTHPGLSGLHCHDNAIMKFGIICSYGGNGYGSGNGGDGA